MKKQFILIIAAVGCLLTASYAVADNQPTDDIYATEKTPTLTKEQKKAEKGAYPGQNACLGTRVNADVA